jgi:hypothetical protein
MREGTNHIADALKESRDDPRSESTAGNRSESAAAAPPEEGRARRSQPRDARGRFETLVIANPYGRRVARIREVVVSAFTDEHALAMTQKMIERAENGSESAARLIYQYVLGKPIEGMSPDWVEHDEWRLRMARPTGEEFNASVFSRKPIELANVMGRAMDYKWMSEAEQQIRASLEKDREKEESRKRRAGRKNDQVPESQ